MSDEKNNIKKQKKTPEFKDKKFPSEGEFKIWLKQTTKYKIEFEDHGQDSIEWYLDKGGEVLHSVFPQKIWLGMIVDLSKLKVGNRVHVLNGSSSNELDFKIKKLEYVKDEVDLNE